MALKPLKPMKPKPPKGSKPIKVIKPKKKSEIVQRYIHNITSRFHRFGKKPPIRYRRQAPEDMRKIKVSVIENQINTGYLLEFVYGAHQMQGQVGGWKNDPRPVILVFSDDKFKYIEGINTNYLSDYYLKKLREIMLRFPGVDGENLYSIFKKTAKPAIAGYRKYIRASLKDVYIYVYKDDVLREVDRLHKERQRQKEKMKGK